MKAFKGFNKDMTCNPNGVPFQYAEGKSYEEDRADLCSHGFHACERPVDCFNYYTPGTSVFHEVELDDVSDERRDDDTKLCAKKIRIGARLSVAQIVDAQFEFVKSHTTTENTDPKQASAGENGAASAGENGAASAGYKGAASAGENGAAVSRGSASVEKNGIAAARGNKAKVRGGIGAVLILAEENCDNYEIASWNVAVVDGDMIKPDTYYKLVNGVFTEA